MLKDVLILDLSRVLAGPMATMILSDLGARVIKVEHPQGGDETRGWGPPWFHGESAYYLCANRNKESAAINLAHPKGREIVLALARKAHVLVENFKVGGLARYGLDYKSVKKVNPSIIYCSITGYGQDGPYKDRAGYDFIIQGMSGLMSITGEAQGPPMKVGVAITDVIAGLYSAVAILAALHKKRERGEGEYIDISLLDSAISALVNVASNYLVSGEAPQRYGNAHPNIVPYETFQASDGLFNLGVGNDHQFQRLCQLLGMEGLARDPRFSTNAHRVEHRDRLIPLLNAAFSQKPVKHWLEVLSKEKIPCGPIYTLPQVFSDPQVQARGMVWEVPHLGDVLRMVASPLKFLQEVKEPSPPPLLGEHTEKVLKEILGIKDEEIRALAREGAVVIHHKEDAL